MFYCIICIESGYPLQPRLRSSPLVIAMQNSPTISHTVGLKSTSGKSFSRSLVYIIDRDCEVSCILIFTVPFDT